MSIPSSYSGAGGGGAFFYFLSSFLSAGFVVVYFATGACPFAATGSEEHDPTDPKKSVTFLPFNVLANALTKLDPTVNPDALMTAFNESAVTCDPAPEITKEA
jgi:hypothetical protein